MKSVFALVPAFSIVFSSSASFAAGRQENVPKVTSPPKFKREKDYLLPVSPELKESEAEKEPEEERKEQDLEPAFPYRWDGDIWGILEDMIKPTNLMKFAEDDGYKKEYEKAVAEEKEWRKAKKP